MLLNRRIGRVLGLVSWVGPLFWAASAGADITASGWISPASPATWTSSTTGQVGRSGSPGTITVTATGNNTLTSKYCQVGYGTNSLGTVTITGNGASWTSSTGLNVGYMGNGVLNITSGGAVNGVTGSIAYFSGSTGNATVTGPGSTWTNTGTLYVGDSGNGVLNITNGGAASNGSGSIAFLSSSTGNVTVTGPGSTWTNTGTLYVGDSGKGALTIANGGAVNNGSASIGRSSGTTGQVTVTGPGSKWTNNSSLDVGDSGKGALTIASGGVVNDVTGTIGYLSGSTGTVTVTGPGSKWTNSSNLYVGDYSSGNLNITNGGVVSNVFGTIGWANNSTGTVTVTGAGSRWTSSDRLWVGLSGNGCALTIADGGQVTAQSLTVNASSLISLRVSGNNQLVMGDAATLGSVANSGAINLYASTFLASGIYAPLAEYSGQPLFWSGPAPNAFGGTWNSGNQTFTVPDQTLLPAGVTGNLVAGERLVVSGSGRQVGASFGTGVDGIAFSANLMTPSQINSLQSQLPASQTVLSGWNFSTGLTGNTVMLSYDIGTGATNLGVWHYDGSTWSSYSTGNLVYDSAGVASFTVSSFSGYALTGTLVPEPATLGLLGLGLAWMLRRTRRSGI